MMKPEASGFERICTQVVLITVCALTPVDYCGCWCYLPLRGVFLLMEGGCIVARRHVGKGRSARKFRSQVGRTHPANMARPGRGGFRL